MLPEDDPESPPDGPLGLGGPAVAPGKFDKIIFALSPGAPIPGTAQFGRVKSDSLRPF